MKSKLIALALFAGSALFGETRFSVHIGVGGGYQPAYAQRYFSPGYAYAAQPPCPGPDYIWVDGYRGRDRWVAGYWTLPARPNYYRGDYRDRDDRSRDYREHGYRDRDDREHGHRDRDDYRDRDYRSR